MAWTAGPAAFIWGEIGTPALPKGLKLRANARNLSLWCQKLRQNAIDYVNYSYAKK